MFHDAQTAKSCSRFEPCLIRLHRATHRQSASEHREHVMMPSLSCWQRAKLKQPNPFAAKLWRSLTQQRSRVWRMFGIHWAWFMTLPMSMKRWSAACARRVTSAARYSNKELQSQVILFELKSGRCELSRLWAIMRDQRFGPIWRSLVLVQELFGCVCFLKHLMVCELKLPARTMPLELVLLGPIGTLQRGMLAIDSIDLFLCLNDLERFSTQGFWCSFLVLRTHAAVGSVPPSGNRSKASQFHWQTIHPSCLATDELRTGLLGIQAKKWHSDQFGSFGVGVGDVPDIGGFMALPAGSFRCKALGPNTALFIGEAQLLVGREDLREASPENVVYDVDVACGVRQVAEELSGARALEDSQILSVNVGQRVCVSLWRSIWVVAKALWSCRRDHIHMLGEALLHLTILIQTCAHLTAWNQQGKTCCQQFHAFSSWGVQDSQWQWRGEGRSRQEPCQR